MAAARLSDIQTDNRRYLIIRRRWRLCNVSNLISWDFRCTWKEDHDTTPPTDDCFSMWIGVVGIKDF